MSDELNQNKAEPMRASDKDLCIVQYGEMIFPCSGAHARNIKARIIDVIKVTRSRRKSK